LFQKINTLLWEIIEISHQIQGFGALYQERILKAEQCLFGFP